VSAARRVCIWSSGFQADTQALVHHLAGRSGWAVTVAIDDPDRYAREPVNRILPIAARFVDRAAPGEAARLEREGYDLLIVDNHLPDVAIAPRLFVLWHGLGWRVDDVSVMRKELRGLVGDVTRPNPRFRWSAAGEWDREYRIRRSRLAPENVVSLGSPYSDLLLPASSTRAGFRREDFRDAYPVDVAGRKNILLGLTWHHGAALAQWGSDPDLLGRLFDHAASRGANVLVRLHDRRRFDPDYLRSIARVASGRPGVWICFKDEHPDSLVDLLLTDVMVSNYSSLLNAFYHTRRPTVHLDPHVPGQEGYVYRRWKRGKLREERPDEAEAVWKLDPGTVGGLRAGSFDQALAQIDTGLADPDCCARLARAFTDRFIASADGRSAERMARFLEDWMAQDPGRG
jgi:CDP-Glycerol:Poly(glycerophosphate) glycerophosphotransferase